MRILILDDDEIRHNEFAKVLDEHEVLHAYTAGVAIKWMTEQQFDLILLDHDLGEYTEDGEEITGMAAAQFLALHLPFEQRPLMVIVHSWNLSRAVAMVETLRKAGLNVQKSEFGLTLLDSLKGMKLT